MFKRCFHPGLKHNPVAAPQIDYIALRTSRDRAAVDVGNSKHSLINGQDSSILSPTDRCSDLGAMQRPATTCGAPRSRRQRVTRVSRWVARGAITVFSLHSGVEIPGTSAEATADAV